MGRFPLRRKKEVPKTNTQSKLKNMTLGNNGVQQDSSVGKKPELSKTKTTESWKTTVPEKKGAQTGFLTRQKSEPPKTKTPEKSKVIEPGKKTTSTSYPTGRDTLPPFEGPFRPGRKAISFKPGERLTDVGRLQTMDDFGQLDVGGGNASVVYKLRNKDMGVRSNNDRAIHSFFKEDNSTNLSTKESDDAVALCNKLLSKAGKNSKAHTILPELLKNSQFTKSGSRHTLLSDLKSRMESEIQDKTSEDWLLCKKLGIDLVDTFFADETAKGHLSAHFVKPSDPKNQEAYDKLRKGNINISKRNVAMSRVAGLLGVPDLLAKSENARLIETKHGGRKKTGNLMAAAKGKEFDELFSEDKKVDTNVFGDKETEREAAVKHFKTDVLKEKIGGGMYKDMVKMTVLDMLCSQSDRHFRNMFYDVDDKGKINGVQGIDNDLAFGTHETVTKRISGVNNMTNDTFAEGKVQLRHMDKKMAESIINLQPSDLDKALDGLIDELEINAMKKRLKEMQELFENDMKEHPEKYLDNDEDWEKKKNEELDIKYRSDFGKADLDYFHRMISSASGGNIRATGDIRLNRPRNMGAVN